MFFLNDQWYWHLFRRSGISPGDTWDLWFRSNSFLLASLVMVGIFSVVVVLLLGCHLYLVSISCTTWEFMSRHRISYLKHCDSEQSPFDRGVFCNLWDFFCICRTVVWEQMYLRNNTSSIWPCPIRAPKPFHLRCGFAWWLHEPTLNNFLVSSFTFVLMNQWLFWLYEKEDLFLLYIFSLYLLTRVHYIKWYLCCL